MDDGKKSILIVDDEPEILKLFEAVMEDIFSVETVSDVPTAKKILQRKKFDLVVTDMVMPGVSGVELVAHIRREYPALKVLVMTGIEDSLTKLHELGDFEILAKPFRFKSALKAVEKILAQG